MSAINTGSRRRGRPGWGVLFLALTVLLGSPLEAARTYQKPSDFVNGAFGGRRPAAKLLTLSSAQHARASRLLGQKLNTSRVRYWTSGERMVVILEGIGKTEFITTGLVVDRGRITQVKVLIYRESHGSEVRRTSFTKQFIGASLNSSGQLDRRINNIAGATLSVRTLTGLSRVALYLDQIRPK